MVFVLFYFNVPCLFLYATGFPCPGCGMTRALICAIHFDFKSAFYYNFMFWVVPFMFLLLLIPRELFSLKKQKYFWIFCGCGFFVNWIFHLFFY
ncbi:MAG: DUF2752 domain-containing protein [Clostridia bacterium]|nr:DUF2752 domain-containing protein [Clostridia bacterium]